MPNAVAELDYVKIVEDLGYNVEMENSFTYMVISEDFPEGAAGFGDTPKEACKQFLEEFGYFDRG